MTSRIPLGPWMKQRRKLLEMTQAGLAQRVPCAVITVQKLEEGKLHPSHDLALRLANVLEIAPEKIAAFVAFACDEGNAGDAFLPPLRLPASFTPLIGREQAVASACKALMRDETRLMTLLGPPGIGKTRLALKVAEQVYFRFEQGALFVPLAPIPLPELVWPAICQALTHDNAGHRNWRDHLIEVMQPINMLLILDNLEHVITIADGLAMLIAACPLLKVLATSRTALNVQAERRFTVPPLELPNLSKALTVADIGSAPAVMLFVERAQAIAPGFTLNKSNAVPIAQICHQLDGIPLAIELVAARVRLMSPAMLLERMHSQWLLQAEGMRDVDARHRTLHQAIAWSYDLLSTNAQRLFRRLGVFAGGWTSKAAIQICADDALPAQEIAALQSTLIDRSLVTSQEQAGEIRFSLLETIHEFARQQLDASAEVDAVKRRHALHYLAALQEASPHFTRADAMDWLPRMIRENANVHAALDWADRAGEAALLAELVLAFANLAWINNEIEESRDWVLRAIKMLPNGDVPAGTQSRLFASAGIHHFLLGDYAPALPFLAKAVSLARESEDVDALAWAQFNLALCTRNAGDTAKAEALWLDTLQLAMQSKQHWIEGMTLGNLSEIERERGYAERAEQLCRQGIALLQGVGDAVFGTMLLNNLGAMLLEQGRLDASKSVHLQCLRTVHAAGNIREIAYSLEKLAGIALAQGDAARSARLLGAAHALRQQSHMPVEPPHQTANTKVAEEAREQLGAAMFTAAWDEGRSMNRDQIAAYAIGEAVS